MGGILEKFHSQTTQHVDVALDREIVLMLVEDGVLRQIERFQHPHQRLIRIGFPRFHRIFHGGDQSRGVGFIVPVAEDEFDLGSHLAIQRIQAFRRRHFSSHPKREILWMLHRTAHDFDQFRLGQGFGVEPGLGIPGFTLLEGGRSNHGAKGAILLVQASPRLLAPSLCMAGARDVWG